MRALLSAVIFALMSFAVTSADAQNAGSPPPAGGQGKEHRIAFVVGNESYAAGALPTAANDAGLVAQTLQAAGFEVVGARDLDAETLRQSYADFVKKVSDAGPDTVAFVYMAGYGVQYGTDNFYVPIGATIARDADIPIESIRLSDLTGPLVTMNLKARFFVFDSAYKTPFKPSGAPLAEGFSLLDAGPGTLIAYNAAPGTVAPVAKGNYGVYAQSLAAMLREGGLPPDEIFDRVRLRVNDVSKGAEVPWDSSKIDAAFRFFERGKNAPPPAATPEQTVALAQKPLKDLPVQQAYTAAVARDTIQSYEQFTAVYPRDPLTKRARVLLAARREAITWRRTIAVDTPPAYWSYLSRYPHGPHAYDARLRLDELSAQEAPPPDYTAIVYDVPPPPPEEVDFVDQPVIYFEDAEFEGYPPPPPPPDYWLPPVPVAFVDLPPPPPAVGLFLLPVPAFVPLPVYYDPPPYVVYPTQSYFYGDVGGPGLPYEERFQRLHQGFPAGGPALVGGGGPNRAAVIGAAAVGAAAVALPAAALARSNALEKRGITTPAQLNALRREPGGVNGSNGLNRPGTAGNAGAAGVNPPARNALPGANGRPLPTPNAQRGPAANTSAGARPNGLDQRAGRPGEPGGRAGAGGAAERRDALSPRGGAPNNAAGRPERQQQKVQERQDRTQERQQRLQDRRNAIEQRRQERQAAPQRQERNAGPQGREAPRNEPRPQAPRNAVQERLQERGRPSGGVPGGAREFRAPQERAAPGPRPGGFGGGGPGPRAGGFPGAGGAPHPGGGGIPGGGGGPRPGGGGGGGPRPGGGGGGVPHPGGGGGGAGHVIPGHP